jgi:hypothetical protein
LSLSRKDAYDFLSTARLAALSTISGDGKPESALVNVAVTPELELIFETIQTTRKCVNLRRDPRVAFVCWHGDETLQYEGIADEPDAYALQSLLDIFFAACPDALAHRDWPGLTYFRVRPRWIRLSRYGASWSVKELSLANHTAGRP